MDAAALGGAKAFHDYQPDAVMQLLTTSTLRNGTRRSAFRQAAAWRTPLAIFVATTLLAIVLKPLLDGEVSSGLIFVLGITLVGATSGLAPALIASLFASAIFNFFLADPVLTFRMSSGADLAPPVIFTACAVVSGLLAGRLADKTFQLGRTNLQLESLLDTSRLLQAAPDVSSISAALASSVPGRLGFRLSLFGVKDGVPVALASSYADLEVIALAQAALENEGPSCSGEAIAFRLDGSRSCVGALAIENLGGAKVDRAFLEALASLVGLALERAQFASVIAETQANARTEELKSALLSSVSHDLRTPLTAISASASSLIEFGSRLDDATSRTLLQGIVDECERLNRFTANLLELSRLQAGGPAIQGQVLSVNDMVRSVAQRLRTRFSSREITVAGASPESLVRADTALFELALTNVIQNALIYSDVHSPVCVECRNESGRCLLMVSDEGCGISEADQPRVFERFFRVKRPESSRLGSGLGLAIAKGFVEAFDGTIEIQSPGTTGKGTTVTISLPIVNETGK